ncbi:hypothetical protein V7124_01360 [Neobacillus niacini]|uniref:hypothetical protein n=1 Tax=Neobacillus niacini TaxID=86668 RepID=UPI003000DB49
MNLEMQEHPHLIGDQIVDPNDSRIFGHHGFGHGFGFGRPFGFGHGFGFGYPYYGYPFY